MFEKIKNIFKSKEKIEKEEIAGTNVFEEILKAIFHLTTSQLALGGGFIFIMGLYTQHMILTQFIGGVGTIYFINLEYSIIFFAVLLFTLIFALIFSFVFIWGLFVFVIVFLIAIFIDINIMSYLTPIFLVTTGISIIFMFFKGYRRFLLKHQRALIWLVLFGFVVSFILSVNTFAKMYKDVNIITSSEKLEGKLYFSNGNYYFIEINEVKTLIPVKEVKKIELLD